MSQSPVDRIADAVLYEGYILYPYRPSIKNHQRWTFGGLFPEEYCRHARSGDVSKNQTECPIRGTPETSVGVRVRFLHLTDRRVGAIDPPLAEWNEEQLPTWRIVPRLAASGTTHHAWQEAEEREVTLEAHSLEKLARTSYSQAFSFTGGSRVEPLMEATGEVVGVLIRQQETVEGSVDLSAVEVGPGLFRLTVRVSCTSALEDSAVTRDEAALRSLVSTHTILRVKRGEFISLVDPPEWGREAAAGCRNVGTWPVMVGEEGETETMLSAPIILPDYPQIAPESPGDFFDGTEMDEMLTLRILTMTDEEKQSMSSVDRRARALLARTESMQGDARMGLHGVLRGGWSTKEGADVQPGTGK